MPWCDLIFFTTKLNKKKKKKIMQIMKGLKHGALDTLNV